MEIVLAIFAIIAIICVIIYVVAPIASILATLALIIGGCYALAVSLKSFFTSLSDHMDPYTTYVDSDPRAGTGVKRSYFFGPGYHQIQITVKDAFSNQREYFDKVSVWVKSFRSKHVGQWYITIWINIFYISACICIYVFGFTWVALFSVLLFSVIFTGMCGFYVFFSILWLLDRLTLILRSIQSRCPNCKRISVVPIFCCPQCGAEHRNLTPGPYGVFHMECSCGYDLPTTVLNGRSKLEAKCPYCQSELAASNATQFGIQLVGGVSAGKTTYLAAFWHMYLEHLGPVRNGSYRLFPQDDFDELEYWFGEGLSSSTNETNAKMYSIVHEKVGEVPFQLTLYDVAGESFSNLESEIQQQQFKYCEGLIIVVDPTEKVNFATECISGFLNELRRLKGTHASQMTGMPVAVLISKGDLFKKEIGLPKIRTAFNLQKSQSENTEITFESVRTDMSRNFLSKIGFDAVLNLLDGEFNNVEYFPISAIGHQATQGVPYEPWGVIEPVEWIMKKSNKSIMGE